MAITIEQFSGIIPKTSAELLPLVNASVADGCTMASGKILPRKAHKDIQAVSAGTKTIYLHNGAWLSWKKEVDAVKSPVSNDAFDRLYYSGDGAPKVRGSLGTFALGIPAPTVIPAAASQQKTEIRWTRTWQYQYEEPDGTVSQEGDLVEGVDITELIPGQNYSLAAIPAKAVGVSADAMFIVYFDGYTDTDIPTYLGRVYPDISLYVNQTDLYVDGALVSMAQVNSAGATFALSFDTSRASDYTKERVYVYTWITAYGEESAPSDPSELVEVSPVQDAVLTGLPTEAPAGYLNVIKKRIYRTVTTDAGTLYRMVADVDIADGSYIDFALESDLLGVLNSADWNPPPEDLAGLCVTSNGVLCGFTGRTGYFSEPYRPHAWPAKYQFEAQSAIVAVKPVETGIAVITVDNPELIQGDTPETMQRVRLPVQQGGASKQAAVIYRGGLVYVTPDGIGLISGLNHTMISDPYFERDDWQALDPATMIGAVHNQELLLYSDGLSLISDLKNGQLTTDSGTRPVCFYQDADSDKLYFVQADQIKEWRGADTRVTATWRSRAYLFTRPAAPFSVQIQAAGYPVTVNFYADGVLVRSLKITASKLRKFPEMRRTECWAFEVESAYEVRKMVIGTAGGKL